MTILPYAQAEISTPYELSELMLIETHRNFIERLSSMITLQLMYNNHGKLSYL